MVEFLAFCCNCLRSCLEETFSALSYTSSLIHSPSSRKSCSLSYLWCQIIWRAEIKVSFLIGYSQTNYFRRLYITLKNSSSLFDDNALYIADIRCWHVQTSKPFWQLIWTSFSSLISLLFELHQSGSMWILVFWSSRRFSSWFLSSTGLWFTTIMTCIIRVQHHPLNVSFWMFQMQSEFPLIFLQPSEFRSFKYP